MIFNIGIDIVEVTKIKQADNNFLQKIFTENEIKYCENKTNDAQNYAARYAAKKAFFKAIGIDHRNNLNWKEVEILNDKLGKPNIVLYATSKKLIKKNQITELKISLSHIKDTAIAVIILEK